MLYIELITKERETEVFFNGYLHKERFESELTNCFPKEKERMKLLLEKGQYLTEEKICVVKIPTKIVSKSDVSFRIQEAKRGDKLIMRTDATCQIIPRSLLNKIKEIIGYCVQRMQYQY